MAAQVVKSFAEGSWVLVGVQARGYALAQRLKKALETLLGQRVPLGGLDITLHRDDIGRSAHLKVPYPSQLPFSRGPLFGPLTMCYGRAVPFGRRWKPCASSASPFACASS